MKTDILYEIHESVDIKVLRFMEHKLKNICLLGYTQEWEILDTSTGKK